MATRRKKAKKALRKKTATRRKPAAKRAPLPGASSGLFQAAEQAVLRQSDKVVAAATDRYNKLMRQAARATNDASKRKYLIAALSAVAIAGVVANDLRRRIDKQTSGRKKRL
jgi:hypothetical protein